MRYFLVAGISPPIIRNLGNNWQEIRQNTCEEIHQKWLLWSVDRNPPTSAEPTLLFKKESVRDWLHNSNIACNSGQAGGGCTWLYIASSLTQTGWRSSATPPRRPPRPASRVRPVSSGKHVFNLVVHLMQGCSLCQQKLSD